MTLSTIFPLVVGGGGTKLSSAYSSGTTSVTVENASGLPASPNYLSIIDETHVITLLYSSISGNTIGGLSVVEYSPGGNTHTFAIGSTCGRTINKVDIDSMNNNISEKITKSESSLPFTIGLDSGGIYYEA